MTKTNYHSPLQPSGIYHIISRANGSELLFFNDDNREFFLRKYQQHVSPIAETYAWCLLPNHFHLLVRIKPFAEVAAHYNIKKRTETLPDSLHLSDFIMERFSNWLNAYTKAFNKVYGRKGSLFIDYLRTVPITSDQQLAATLFYVHRNPVHHGYCKQLDKWCWSSFNEYCSRQYKWISPAFVQGFFGTTGSFKKFHAQPVLLKEACMLE